jgi:membrane protease YdiL (CAAX protease family)
MRKIIAIVACFGFAVSAILFISSFFGTTMEWSLPLPIVLHIGIFVLVASAVVFERSTGIQPNESWKEFKRRSPDWAVYGIRLLGLFFGIIFVLFLVLSHFATPEIRNGDCILNNHGRIAAVLTESEYLILKGWELRFFASFWMFFYFFFTTYWWFLKNGAKKQFGHAK